MGRDDPAINLPDDAGGTILRAEWWGNDDWNLMAVGILSHAYHCRSCWRCRFRYAWAALRGKLYTDDILLQPKEAHLLAEFIQQVVRKP